MHIASPLEEGPVEYRTSQKFGMVTAIPAIPLLPALDIQGYGIHFYSIFLSLYGS